MDAFDVGYRPSERSPSTGLSSIYEKQAKVMNEIIVATEKAKKAQQKHEKKSHTEKYQFSNNSFVHSSNTDKEIEVFSNKVLSKKLLSQPTRHKFSSGQGKIKAGREPKSQMKSDS